MSYVINKYDGAVITTVEDGTVDQTLDIKLIGKNYAGYGEIQNENFIFMLENFAREVAPPNAIRGQLWFNTIDKKIRFFTGDVVAGAKVWKTAGGVDTGVEPNNPTVGDLWFDTAVNQLKVRTANSWLVIGPQTAGAGVTQMVSRSIRGMDNALHSIIAATVNDEVISIISHDAISFRVQQNDPTTTNLTEFDTIGKGFNLPNANNTNNTRYHGIAKFAEQLVGGNGAFFTDTSFISSTTPVFTTVADFADAGFYVGNDRDLLVSVVSGTIPTIDSKLGNSILFKVQDGALSQTPLVITKTSAEPGITDTYNLGSSTKRWNAVYSKQFIGPADSANLLVVDSNMQAPRAASTTSSAYTIAARDSSGDVYANIFHGVATSARYADLAEKYLADEIYPIGTVVIIGGEKEVTASEYGKRALGVVSENPAVMMNSELENGTYIALKGRVPVFVNGPVSKGDELIADNHGCATAMITNESSKVFAIALEDNSFSGIRLVECAIL
jgi:putative methionine-R-sulfoxide reductase with GAF domain